MTIESETLFEGRIYRVTGEPVVANLESKIGARRELHLASCRTLRKYPADSPTLVPLSAAEVDEAWVRAVDEGTTAGILATEWPFSEDTGWCPHCIVKKLPPGTGGSYRHPLARSPKWRPGVPLACRFPTAHGLGHCGCEVDQPPA